MSHDFLHPTTILADLAQHHQPPPGTIYPPSHYTRAQVVRILERPTATVHAQAKPGGPLQAETWHGTKMIPAWRVLQALREQQEDRD